MASGIITSGTRRRETRVSRYMQEIRDIVKAGLSRRELLRMGLALGGAGVATMQGMRNVKPYWAHADNGAGGIQFQSPPNTPFVEPLPIPQVMLPVTLDPAPTRGTNPIPSRVTGFREATRPDHQFWEHFVPVKMFESVERPVQHDFYADIDGVPPSTIWTFVEASTGRAGPLWIQARYGEPVVHRVHNALPADSGGFGINQTSTHLHNGHTASESDGGPTHFYDSGFFKDYHYPNIRAGFAGNVPESSLNGRTVPGDVRETMGFLWFHDHRIDFTSQNVYKGLAGFYTLFSDDILLDTGDETTGLRLPGGEFDIPMIFADKVFDPGTGLLFFDLFNLDGILGDKYSVNGKIQPYLEVKRRRYRFRLLDGGPSRVYEFFLSDGTPFVQITNDGNLLPHPLLRNSIRLGVAERVDVIVDFSGTRIGDRIYLQNRLEQTSGRGPTGKIVAPTDLVEFRVTGDAGDGSLAPDPRATLLALPDRNTAVAQNRQWEFVRSGGAWVVNGSFFDPDVISAFPLQNTAEIWTLKSGKGWLHPVHIHLEEFQILSRDGKAPPADEIARKDVTRIGENVVGTDGTGELKLYMRFRDFLGDYPMHCHNTLHEDHAMMIRFQVVP